MAERPHPAILPPESTPVHGWLPGAVVWRCGSCAHRVLGWVAPAPGGGWVLLLRFGTRHGSRQVEATGTAFRQKCDVCETESCWPPLTESGAAL